MIHTFQISNFDAMLKHEVGENNNITFFSNIVRETGQIADYAVFRTPIKDRTLINKTDSNCILDRDQIY